jgi:phosphatidate cytidylyltransferase
MNTVPPAKKSDLGVRTLSAIVMLAVAGTALWLGGWWWTAFVALVAIGVWFEWSTLVVQGHPPGAGRMVWRLGGVIYCGVAASMLIAMRSQGEEIFAVLLVVGAVIVTDVGAYFAGRTFGGPKIAPKISPSKTWAGLIGGMLGASILLVAWSWAWRSGLCDVYFRPREFGFDGPCSSGLPPISYYLIQSVIGGALIAIVAQSGDFFESWMKRRAGVKDSGNLIPGHGGLFDRVDGLLAVCFVLGVIFMVPRLWGAL